MLTEAQACVRACVRACVLVCVRASMCAFDCLSVFRILVCIEYFIIISKIILHGNNVLVVPPND